MRLDIGAISADASQLDNGFCTNIRSYYKSSLGHLSSLDAASNLGKLFEPGKTTFLVGHGQPGEVSTGRGYDFTTWDDELYVSKEGNWEYWADPWLYTLRDRLEKLWLVSCSVYGKEGWDGPYFVSCLAELLGVDIVACDGIVFSSSNGEIRIEWGSYWHQVSPSGHVEKLKKSEDDWLAFTNTEDAMGWKVAKVGQGFKEAGGDDLEFEAIDRVKKLTLRRIDRAPKSLMKFESLIELTSQWEGVRVSDPIVFDGAPGSSLLGILDLQYERDGEVITREFALYGGKLLQDKQHPNVFYKYEDDGRLKEIIPL